jgi:hypothetical protein
MTTPHAEHYRPDCPDDKVGSWPTWTKANQARKRINRKPRQNGLPPLRSVYRCPQCTWFHLTTRERAAERAHDDRIAREGKRRTR